MNNHTINFVLNGRPVSATVKADHNIVEVLQDQFGLFGARESCGEGVCGCCTVLVDDSPVAGCLSLAVMLEGKSLTTIEHLDAKDGLTQLQEAFIEAGAFQCGFCTPGFVLMAEQLLKENPDPSEDQIGEALSGNLCRCGAYPEITKAVRLVAEWQKGEMRRPAHAAP
jgi:aerobic carbon-monoxide dehydrogenase small subunit